MPGSRYDFENLYPPDEEMPASQAPAATQRGSGSRYDFNRLYPAEEDTATPPPARTLADFFSKAPAAFGALTRSIPQTADDVARAAANAFSFGMADRAAGALNRATGLTDAPDYSSAVNEEVARSEAARERNPYAGITGDVAGTTAQVLAAPVTGGGSLVARLAAGPLGRTVVGQSTRVAGPAARAVGYGTAGAATGALQGAGGTYSENLPDYINNAMLGGVLGFGTGAVTGAAFGPRPPRDTRTPTTNELYGEKVADYKALANSPAPYDPAALARTAGIVENTLRNPPYRFQEQYSPLSFKALEEMRNPPTTAHLGKGAIIYPGDIEAIRQGITTNLNPVTAGPDLASSKIVKRALDEFVRNPPPDAVLPGAAAASAAAEASALANRARGNYAGFKRGQAFDDLISNATDATKGANSGLNLENMLRGGVKNFIKQNKGMSPASKAGYTPEEIATLRQWERGSIPKNVERYIGNLMGGGGGLGTAFVGSVGGGFATHYLKDDPVSGAVYGSIPAAAGLAIRLAGNRRANREINALGDMIRQRTPLYQDRLQGAPTSGASSFSAASPRNAVTFELLRHYRPQED